MTFFPFQGSGQGTVGKGQAGRVYFSVPKGSLSFWKERLEKNGLNLEEKMLFGEKGLIFDDTEDLPLAIMEDAKSGKSEWTPDGISQHEAIMGMKGVLLYSYDPQATIQLLTESFGYTKAAEEGQIVRLTSSATIGGVIDVHLHPEKEGWEVMARYTM